VILPTKHLPPERSLLFAAAHVLVALEEPDTVSSVWEHLRGRPGFESFDRYVLSLDLLAIFGLVHLEHGRLTKGDGS